LATAVLVLTFLLTGTRPAAAADCFQQIAACYQAAAQTTFTYTQMWLMGLDCELSLIDCVRRAVLGR
jgi:hypothetical protein